MKRASRFAVQPGWRLLLNDMGVSIGAVLAHAGLPPDLFAREKAWLTPDDYFRLWDGLEATIGAGTLPLALARAVSVEAFDPATFACICSPNLNVAMQRLAMFKRLICPIEIDVHVGQARTELVVHGYGNEGPLPSSLGVTEFAFITQVARLATRHPLKPASAHLVSPPADTVACEAFFGCRLRKGPVNRLAFSAEDAQRPFLTENAQMWQVFEPALRQRLSELDRRTRIDERVRVALLDMLPSGRASLDDVASRLFMSRRTLQRHLAEERVNFQDVLDATRRDLARHYLLQTTVSTGEIALLLAFRDANSFLRAFKGWTGTTPGAFRRPAGGKNRRPAAIG